MIRRKKSTMFLDAKEDTSVLELKKMISGESSCSMFLQKIKNCKLLRVDQHVAYIVFI